MSCTFLLLCPVSWFYAQSQTSVRTGLSFYYRILVILLLLFESLFSSSGCLGKAALFYCCTPCAFHITIFHAYQCRRRCRYFALVNRLIIRMFFLYFAVSALKERAKIDLTFSRTQNRPTHPTVTGSYAYNNSFKSLTVGGRAILYVGLFNHFIFLELELKISCQIKLSVILEGAVNRELLTWIFRRGLPRPT